MAPQFLHFLKNFLQRKQFNRLTVSMFSCLFSESLWNPLITWLICTHMAPINKPQEVFSCKAFFKKEIQYFQAGQLKYPSCALDDIDHHCGKIFHNCPAARLCLVEKTRKMSSHNIIN